MNNHLCNQRKKYAQYDVPGYSFATLVDIGRYTTNWNNFMKLLLAIILIHLLSGCATVKQVHQPDAISTVKPELDEDKLALRESFVGKWLSHQPTKDGGFRNTVIVRHPDSRYFIEFKIYDSLGVQKDTHNEFGFWGVSGGIYFTMYRAQINNDKYYEIDTSDAYNYDSYKILSTSEQKLIYQSLSSGNKYTYKKVE